MCKKRSLQPLWMVFVLAGPSNRPIGVVRSAFRIAGSRIIISKKPECQQSHDHACFSHRPYRAGISRSNAYPGFHPGLFQSNTTVVFDEGCGKEQRSGPKQASEKGLKSSEITENCSAGAEAKRLLSAICGTTKVMPCYKTVQSLSFSAACLGLCSLRFAYLQLGYQGRKAQRSVYGGKPGDSTPAHTQSDATQHKKDRKTL